jgi:hypothetical protein
VLSGEDNLVGLEIGWWTDGRDGQAHFPALETIERTSPPPKKNTKKIIKLLIITSAVS